MEYLLDWMNREACKVMRKFHALDLFGASRRVTKTWASKGWNSISYDIKISKRHDITSMAGFMCLLAMAVQQLASVSFRHLPCAQPFSRGVVATITAHVFEVLWILKESLTIWKCFELLPPQMTKGYRLCMTLPRNVLGSFKICMGVPCHFLEP